MGSQSMTVLKLLVATALMTITSLGIAADAGKYGYFKTNEVSVPLNDKLVVWNDDNGELKVILTPSELTADERDAIEGGEDVFFVTSDKTSPDDDTWQWYPHVVIELTFDPADVATSNLSDVYIKAYGIAEKNYTTSLNPLPDEATNNIDQLGRDNSGVSLHYRGESSILDKEHRWEIEL